MVQKNRKTTLVLLLFLVCFVSFSVNLSAVGVTINDLIEESFTYDGQTVTLEAEAIGEALQRGDFTWINVNDGTNAIGIWIPSIEAEKIQLYGNYATVGDTISLTGVFHRSCTEHGGDVDIHTNLVIILIPGTIVNHPLSIPKLIWASSLSGGAIICMILFLHDRQRKKASTVHSSEEEE
jgi:hypothetical protein